MIAAGLTEAYADSVTPLLVQFMVDGDEARVIEFAPRVGGGLNYRFGEVRNVDALLGEGTVAEFYLHKARGAPIGASMSSSDRVASFMVRADSEAELLSRTREAMQRLDVVDVEGRSIMRRDVYLKAL